MSMSSSKRLYFDRSSSLPLSSSLLLLEEVVSFRAILELLLLGVFSSRLFRRESLSLDELDFLSRFDDDLLDRFRLLLSDEEDDELLSLERDRDRDLDLDLERVSRRLERFELSDLLSLLVLFLRRPNSSYSESDDCLSLYSTTSRSL